MKNLSMKMSIAAIACAMLASCGGGSGSGSVSIADASTNAFTNVAGTYVLPCTGDTSNGGAGESSQGTAIVATASGSNQADVSLHYQYYDGSTNCTASTLNIDLTVNGQLGDKGTTKNYTDAGNNTVTAKVATFTYTGLTLAKGNLNVSVPTAGASTDIAYVLTGNKLYVSKGHRGADGLGDSLIRTGAVKQ